MWLKVSALDKAHTVHGMLSHVLYWNYPNSWILNLLCFNGCVSLHSLMLLSVWALVLISFISLLGSFIAFVGLLPHHSWPLFFCLTAWQQLHCKQDIALFLRSRYCNWNYALFVPPVIIAFSSSFLCAWQVLSVYSAAAHSHRLTA